MCHPRGSNEPIENREPTSEKRESRNERERAKDERTKDEGILARTKAIVASLFDTPGENGRREPDSTMRIDGVSERRPTVETNRGSEADGTEESLLAND
ncbi:hypothetical protein [Haladaptatus sp. DFWS20]|uniref:hypothetical protein n=1 Tax=Haladaptatus sp. DFWS20 TaxID=3403467 RepID=UPI003EB99854